MRKQKLPYFYQSIGFSLEQRKFLNLISKNEGGSVADHVRCAVDDYRAKKEKEFKRV